MERDHIQTPTTTQSTSDVASSSRPGTYLADNRKEAVAQRALSELANNSPQSQRAHQLRAATGQAVAQLQGTNATKGGLPEQLKSGIESLSGVAMDDVKVHYNSSRPAHLNAHAYAQGSEIHLGPGQEKHLPHEAWHVVQQAQGRVRPTMQLASAEVNDDAGLEQEADTMGARALSAGAGLPASFDSGPAIQRVPSGIAPIQRVELNLPNGAEAWTVNSETHAAQVKSWIDHQAEQSNSAALLSLMQQLQQSLRPSSADAFLLAYAITKLAEVRSGLPAKIKALRRLANPGEITDVGAYVNAQTAYQNLLANNYSMAQIMATHQSAGLEFEFATYTSAEEVSSHHVLAESAPMSGLFHLPFVLETDSGKELEIGFPPFLVPHDTNTKAHIKAIWQTMRAKMAEIREAARGDDVTALMAKIQAAGLGKGWHLKDEVAADLRVAAERTKHTGTTAMVYSQLNLSMHGAESAALIDQVSRSPDRFATSAERELIIPVYGEVEHMLAGEREAIADMTQEIFIHVAKAATSAMAIPSIMISGSPLLRLIRMEGLFDLQSTVKELHGVWVKDSLPNILRTIGTEAAAPAADLLAAARSKLLIFIRAGIQKQLEAATEGSALRNLDEGLKSALQSISLALGATLSDAQTWMDEEDWGKHAALNQRFDQLDQALQTFARNDGYRIFPELVALRQQLRVLRVRFARYRPDTTGQEEHYEPGDGFYYLTSASWTEPAADVEKLQNAKKTVEGLDARTFLSKLTDRFTAEIIGEIDGAIATLRSARDYLPSPKTGFNKSEKFGQGLGVRKDTHIKTLPASKSVAEIRGDSIIGHYLG